MPQRPKPITPDDPRHGTLAGYYAEYKQLGGRKATCERCRAAEVAYQQKRSRLIAYGRPPTIPSIGTNRRLQALMAIGWPGTYLAQELGVARGNLPLHQKYPKVHASTADAVKYLYERLVNRDGPSDLTRRRAERAGWATPDQWLGRDMDDPAVQPAQPAAEDGIDEIAVERALAAAETKHEYVRLTREEQVELIRRALKHGVSLNKTMTYLKVNGSVFAELHRQALEDA